MPIQPIYLKIGPNWPNRQCCLAGSSKTALRILIFSIATGADNSFYVKSIATYALTFFGYIISVLAIVCSMYLTTQSYTRPAFYQILEPTPCLMLSRKKTWEFCKKEPQKLQPWNYEELQLTRFGNIVKLDLTSWSRKFFLRSWFII